MDPETPSSETIYRIPPRHRDCHLHNFDWSRTSVGTKGKKAIDQFLKEWEEGEAPHLILIGEPGLGKTHLGVGIFRRGVFETSLMESVFIHVPSFCDKVKKTYGDNNAGDPYDDIRSATLLVLDDLFGRDLNKHELDQIIPRIISIAYDNSAALLVTTNYSKEGINNKLHPHEASRLFANAKIINFKGRDQRL